MARTTINWRVHELIKEGILQRIGRGLFTLESKPEYIPGISRRQKQISQSVKKNFPLIDYCIWDSKYINEFTHHIGQFNYMIVDVERDTTESVYYLLKEEYQNVFHKPDPDLLDSYIRELNSSIIVRPLVTETPTQTIKNHITVTLEKLLVDIFSDEEFDFLQGNELINIFNNAFNRYTVNQSKLFRYADRKRKKTEIIDFLNNYNLAAKH